MHEALHLGKRALGIFDWVMSYTRRSGVLGRQHNRLAIGFDTRSLGCMRYLHVYK